MSLWSDSCARRATRHSPSMAMQVYAGPKAVLADAELSYWFHVTKGMAAGCPQAPLLAKTFLQPILGPFQAKYQGLHLNGWIDDGSHTDAQALAHRVTSAWKDPSTRGGAEGEQPKNGFHRDGQDHAQSPLQASTPRCQMTRHMHWPATLDSTVEAKPMWSTTNTATNTWIQVTKWYYSASMP